ncbi:MinD/ParA family protein [Clostridium sp. cel8]|jgi:flagellar biosynthesis protein FlhG|uniref:MinD/ParA family protein n=1 Tax=unclassified Clostridium TaxID=2614128 RepID=UPI0015F5C36A|nr:MinD/ParA family protein [Clostridium sp. cel8]MBA5850675.1 MinD/ParA family protein [Clostridium sp. cel8]
MLDQAQKLRELVHKNKSLQIQQEDSSKKPIILTVTSGKGGVGKSNFVVNAAICLQKMGKNVLIFDADVGMGNDDVLMGFLPRYSVYDIIFKGKSVEDVVINGPFGIKLLPGGTGIPKLEGISESQINNFINELSHIKNLDYIIMDTGAGINKSVLGFVSCCDELFVITTPEPTSLMDAYSLIKAVDYFNLKNSASLIVNRVSSGREGKNTFNKFNAAVDKFLNIDLEYLGCISDDKKVLQAVRNQVPFVINYPLSEASKNINSIIHKIIGIKSSKTESGIQEMFKKLFNIFS